MDEHQIHRGRANSGRAQRHILLTHLCVLRKEVIRFPCLFFKGYFLIKRLHKTLFALYFQTFIVGQRR